MTERLPDSGENNWADTLGAGDGTGGFLRVAHNDDGTLLPIETNNGAPANWEINSAGATSITAASATSDTFLYADLSNLPGIPAAVILMANGIVGLLDSGIDITKTGASSNRGLQVFTNVNDGVSVAEFGSFGADSPIRFAGEDAWFVLFKATSAPTTGDLNNNECAMWFDAGVPSIKFLAESGETGEIVLT